MAKRVSFVLDNKKTSNGGGNGVASSTAVSQANRAGREQHAVLAGKGKIASFKLAKLRPRGGAKNAAVYFPPDFLSVFLGAPVRGGDSLGAASDTENRAIRDIVRGRLHEIFRAPRGAALCDAEAFRAYVHETLPAVNIEKGIFNRAIEFCESNGIVCLWENPVFALLYKKIAENVVQEVLENADLVARMVAGYHQRDRGAHAVVFPHEIAFMSPAELFPEKWSQCIQEDASPENEPTNTTDQYLCYRCNNRKCVYSQRQTRSADEPMTIFIKCTVCGNRWRI